MPHLLKGNQGVLVPFDSSEVFSGVGLSPHGGATSAVAESAAAAVTEPPLAEAASVPAAKGAAAAEAAAAAVAAETSTSRRRHLVRMLELNLDQTPTASLNQSYRKNRNDVSEELKINLLLLWRCHDLSIDRLRKQSILFYNAI